jgi:hypothetical protein
MGAYSVTFQREADRTAFRGGLLLQRCPATGHILSWLIHHLSRGQTQRRSFLECPFMESQDQEGKGLDQSKSLKTLAV